MREEPSKKPWILILVVMSFLSAAFLSTDDAVEASRDGDASPEKTTSVAPRTEVLAAEVEVVDVPEVELVTFETRQQVIDAGWAPHVTLTADESEFRFQSNGLPNHEFPDVYLRPGELGFGQPLEWRTPSEELVVAPIVESIVDQTITLRPVIAEEPSPAPEGVIGVLVGGTQIIHDTDASVVARFETLETGFVDQCNGHPAALDRQTDVVGNYHYHAVPRCSTDAVDIEGQHSSIIGVMIDGLPVYGSNDVGGEPISTRDLDECSGHFGPTPEFPEGIYHYHFLDAVSATPFPCLVGVVGGASAIDEGEPAGPLPLARSNS